MKHHATVYDKSGIAGVYRDVDDVRVRPDGRLVITKGAEQYTFPKGAWTSCVDGTTDPPAEHGPEATSDTGT